MSTWAPLFLLVTGRHKRLYLLSARARGEPSLHERQECGDLDDRWGTCGHWREIEQM